jgi:NTP pyrophosphatase (non-canonical NTP hydrolase)
MKNMLKDMFPNSDKGAALYGGFMQSYNDFGKHFETIDNDIDKTLAPINDFLQENGYSVVISRKDLDEDNSYEDNPISLYLHELSGLWVLGIEREGSAKPQSEFITNQIIEFRNARDWEQFHNPKDLAIALSAEAGELLETFLWKKWEDADKDKIKEELADILIFAYLLADKYKLDIEEIMLDKIKSNNEKYPIHKAKGTAKKYNEL